MFCDKCGKPIPDDMDSCPECGRQVDVNRPEPQVDIRLLLPEQRYEPQPPAQQIQAQPVWKPDDAKLDIGRSFTFVFKDPNWWKKCLLIGLISMIPVIGWLVIAGYFVELARNVAKGKDNPLPDIRFAEQLSLGAPYFLAYFLAHLLVIAGILSFNFISMGIVGHVVEMIVLISIGCMFFSRLYIGLTFILAGIKEEPYMFFSFRACFDAIRNNPEETEMFLLMSIVFGMIGSMALIVCYVVLLITIPLGYMMGIHLGAQLARQLLMPKADDVIPPAGHAG
ncbi:MAG TPA: DUF4013 domain-containing protein [bacterium]|nr:DUF4013 domain-containing protein [bacterium]